MPRQGYNHRWLFLNDSDKVPYGFALGADYCAEHEVGITNLLAALGCDASKSGIDRCRVNINKHTMKNVAYVSRKSSFDILTCSLRADSVIETVKHKYRGELNTVSMWDEKSFCIIARSSTEKDHLALFGNTLYPECNGKVALVGSNVLMNGFGDDWHGDAAVGPCLVLMDRLPAKVIDYIAASDFDAFLLQQESDKIGMKKKLSDAGVGCHSVMPAWLFVKDRSSGWSTETAHKVVYWVNPYKEHEQSHGLHAGWYTVEYLEGIIAKGALK